MPRAIKQLNPRAIIYARFSPRPDADETLSNEKQIEHGRIWCASHQYEIQEILADDDISGGDDSAEVDAAIVLANRPKLMRALGLLKKGSILVVRWRSRIARSVYIQEYAHRRAMRVGARIEATDEPNGDLPTDGFMRHVFAGLAEMQRLEAKINTSRAMRKYQTQGRRMGRADRCPFGFTTSSEDNSLLVPDADEQQTVEMVRAAYRQGMGLREICRHLDRQGRNRRGKTWENAPTVVASILRRLQEPGA